MCMNAARGCTWSGTLGIDHRNLRDHHQACGYDTVLCGACKKTVLRRNIPQHPDRCAARPTRCNDCHVTMKHHEYEAHREVVAPEGEAMPATAPCKGSVLCPNTCRAVLPRGLLDAHLLVCPLRREVCQACDETVLSVEAEQHRAEHCSFRIVECEHCEEAMPFHSMESHVAAATEAFGLSSFCAGYVFCPNACRPEGDSDTYTLWKPANLDAHLQDDCPLRRKPCSMCASRILWSEVETHERERCIERAVECRHCFEPMSFAKLETHLTTEVNGVSACVNTSVCPNSGCEHAGRKEDADAHATECAFRVVECACCNPPANVAYASMHTHVRQQLVDPTRLDSMADLIVRLSRETSSTADTVTTTTDEQVVNDSAADATTNRKKHGRDEAGDVTAHSSVSDAPNSKRMAIK